MSTANTRQTDYYARLDTCVECKATRGQRCRDTDGKELLNAHSSRIISSGAHSEKVIDQTLVECPTCHAAVGVSCRSKPYNTRLSKPHATRRRALEAAQS